MQLPHPPAALSARPFSARLPSQSLLCCPVMGAQDLQRGTRARVPLETAEVSNPPTAKGARWALRDAASMGKYGGRHEVRQRRENTIRNKWGHTLCHRPDVSHVTHPTPLSPVASAVSGRGTLQDPTERAPRLWSLFLLSLLCVITGLALTLHFPLLSANFPSTKGFFKYPAASLSFEFSKILCEVRVLPPPSPHDP